MQDMLNIGYHCMAGAGGLKKREVIEATSSGKMFLPPNLGKRLFPFPQNPYDTNFQHYKCISSLRLTLHPTGMHVA